ncbi:hypothetical protein BH10ACT3_BH10ACT3_17260 [soil metagenome]
MSGPKVVRIVTREEIVQICRSQLARVDAALAEWLRIGKRNDCISDEEVAAAQARRASLAALIQADRFLDLQKQAPREEAFLRDDLRSRLAVVAKAQAAARSKERRDAEAGATLLRTLLARDGGLDAEIRTGLEQGDPASLAKGFALLARPATNVDAEVRRQANRLRGDAASQTFREWLDANGEEADPAIERLEGRIAELAQLVEPERVSGWRRRLTEAASAPRDRRGLLLDGVDVDTGRAVKVARARKDALDELHATLAECAVLGLDPSHSSAVEAECDAVALAELTRQARSVLDERRAADAATARRAAIVKGLAEIGYEVAEGMSTTWVEEGRLVVRNAARPDYGVEVGGVADGRLQIRAVALTTDGHGPDVGRDRDAETIWCGDVSVLQEKLAKAGGGLVIEKARPIGAVPLKRIAMGSGRDTEAVAEVPVLKERSLR